MFKRENDPRLLGFIAIIFLVGALASALGLAHFTVASGITGLRRSSLVEIVTVVGIFGWYFALMYLFSMPGRKIAAQIVGLGLALASLAYFTFLRGGYPELNQPWAIFGIFGCALGYPSLLKMALDRFAGRTSEVERRKLNTLLFVSAGIVLLAFTPQPMLDLTASLHPNTYDAMLYHFESTLGFQPSGVLGQWVDTMQWLRTTLDIAYIVLPLGFAVLLGAQLARPDRPSVNLLAAWIISTAIAVVGFHFLPVAGPKYLYGALHAFMPPVEQVPFAMVQLAPTPRNGVPSMHFGWALLLWLECIAARQSLVALVFPDVDGPQFPRDHGPRRALPHRPDRGRPVDRCGASAGHECRAVEQSIAQASRGDGSCALARVGCGTTLRDSPLQGDPRPRLGLHTSHNCDERLALPAARARVRQ